jgi:anti-sigma-K factor RskA
MDQQRIEELLPFYTLDALTDEERDLVEAYLKEHPEARVQLDEMQSAASALPYAATPVEPSQRLKDALMARVAVDQRTKVQVQKQTSSPKERRWANLFPAFSFAAAVIAVVWVVILNSQLSQLRHDVSALNDALAAQSNSLAQINAKLPQVTASSVVTISLKGTDKQPQAEGQLIADPQKESAVLVIAGLAKLEAGKTYQVWLIKGKTPVSAGLLSVDAQGQAVLILNSHTAIGAFDELGISIEPDGGSPQPTGDIVVLSHL